MQRITTIFVMLVATAACGDGRSNEPVEPEPKVGPPLVAGISPTSGPYGAEVTIAGENLTGAEVMFARQDAEPFPVASREVDSGVQVRVPFPVSGVSELFLCSSASDERDPDCVAGTGKVPAGDFEIDSPWTPGSAHPVLFETNGFASRRTVLDAIVLSSGHLLAVLASDDGPPRVVVFNEDAAAATGVPLEGISLELEPMPRSAFLVEHGGEVEVFSEDGTGIYRHSVGADAEATAVDLDGRLLAAGTDDQGPYVWVGGAREVSRMRAGEPWTADRSVTTPGVPHTAALAADGTLAVVSIVETGDVVRGYRYTGDVGLLLPDGTDFEFFDRATPEPDAGPRNRADEYTRFELQVGPRGNPLLFTYCTKFEGEDASTCQAQRQRTGVERWESVDGTGVVTAAGPGVVSSDEGGLALEHADGTVEKLGLWDVSLMRWVRAEEPRPIVVSRLSAYAPKRDR